MFVLSMSWFINFFLLIYVNDVFFRRSSSSQITKFITHLSTAFHMKDLDNVHYFLSLQIARDKSNSLSSGAILTFPSLKNQSCWF